jgi:hypothetical protein
VVELRVPEVVEDPFREHYRELVMGSLLRAAEARAERHRARGHRLRTRRSERIAQRLRTAQGLPLPDVPTPVAVAAPVEAPVIRAPRLPAATDVPWFGTSIRRAVAVLWFATLAALLANVVVLGIDSYATAAADLGLVVMTFVWFAASIDDLIPPSP